MNRRHEWHTPVILVVATQICFMLISESSSHCDDHRLGGFASLSELRCGESVYFGAPGSPAIPWFAREHLQFAAWAQGFH